MAGINKAIIVGSLGKDPEITYTSDGNAVCKFSIATSESWTDKSGQKRESTEWHNIVVFGKLAENCAEYLTKGSKAYVEGKLKTSSWEKDGHKFYKTEIVAKHVEFLGGGSPRQVKQRDEVPY